MVVPVEDHSERPVVSRVGRKETLAIAAAVVDVAVAVAVAEVVEVTTGAVPESPPVATAHCYQPQAQVCWMANTVTASVIVTVTVTAQCRGLLLGRLTGEAGALTIGTTTGCTAAGTTTMMVLVGRGHATRKNKMLLSAA